ncbi:MAG: 2,3-bisphosphoglycerate-independent phosphoglycerate mutase [Chloroflexota bacterium]
MADFELIKQLAKSDGGKILLLVLDGLGGLPVSPNGGTALEEANTPNFDQLARMGSSGLSLPIGYGIIPGSGPAHLALFGYNPLEYVIGRGVLEAFGIGMEVSDKDVAIRGNFCSLDDNGLITDRRAGRIPTEKCAELCQILSQIEIPDVTIEVNPVKEYRFAVVLRGEGLDPALADTDPQQVGKAPLAVTALAPEAEYTAQVMTEWASQARKLLASQRPANGFTLRGFSSDPKLPKFKDIYKLNAACVAVYPMYKGVSRLVGMSEIPTLADDTPKEQFDHVAANWDSYDFFFIHIKYTDSRGEDGDFEAKKKVIEQVDQALPRLMELNPDVLVVTGDHSTPASLKSHSWHAVPTLIYAPKTHRPGLAQSFGEKECLRGGLGQFPAIEIMPLALAHANRLNKFGA